ncbi:hypothetical protein H9P43_001756 [Blastocladiella emersonii ATCC 22665]|nr:hypothetical protein H9P43_001756 [Blastocladiella emersonii ATCC 22665]
MASPPSTDPAAAAPPPPLLYDLVPTRDWPPTRPRTATAADTAAVASVKPPRVPASVAALLAAPDVVPAWHVALAPSGLEAAIVTDTHLELYALGTGVDSSPDARHAPLATWPLPVRGGAAPPPHDLLVWRRLAWAPRGDLIVVADWDGAMHVLHVGTAGFVHLATLNPAAEAADRAAAAASAGPAIDAAPEPITFVSLLDEDEPADAAAQDGAVVTFKLVWAHLHGTLRLAAGTVTLRAVKPPPSPLVIHQGTAGESAHIAVQHLASFDASPWFDVVADAAYLASERTLYVTGKAAHGCASGAPRARADDEDDDDEADEDDERYPVLALFVSRGFKLHASIPCTLPQRTVRAPGLLGTVAGVARALFGRFGGSGGTETASPESDRALAREREFTGLQLSVWPGADLDSALVLLRDAASNLVVFSGRLDPRDRYDGGFLTLAHRGHALTHAAWWTGAVAPRVATDSAASPFKPADADATVPVPAIVTCSAGGLLTVHSYPAFAPLSAAEQFAAPVAVANSVAGHGCILDCEVTAAPAGAARTAAPAETPRGILARSLRSLTNTFLWQFDDEDAAGASIARSAIAAPAARRCTLYDWRPLSPTEMLVRHLLDQDYDAALALATAHNLDTDIVYQSQWRALMQREQQPQAAVTTGSGTAPGGPDDELVVLLGKIRDTTWVLQACTEALPASPARARALLVHGLRLTESIRAWAEEPEAADAAVDESKLVFFEYRLMLLRLLDRLELYTRIHGAAGGTSTATNLAADPNYAFLRNSNLVDVACAYARVADARALTVLFGAVPALNQFRPLIVACFPAYVDPRQYAALLPTPENASRAAAQIVPAHWRKSDWAEHPDAAARVAWTDDLAAAADALEAGFAGEEPGALTQWYLRRAREMEALSGCADTALRVLELGAARGVKGLGDLMATLRQFNCLVYELLPMAGDRHDVWQKLGLEDFEQMLPAQIVQMFLSINFAEVDAGAASTGAIAHATLDRAIAAFLAPAIVQRRAFKPLLDALVPVFPARRELVVAILEHDDLWWHQVHPDPEFDPAGVDDDAVPEDVLEVMFAEAVLDMAYAVEDVDAAWFPVLDRLYESVPDFSDEPDEEDEEGDGGSDEGVAEKPSAPAAADPTSHRATVWRRIQALEAHITAAELLANVHLYASPAALRDASHAAGPAAAAPVSPTAPAWLRDQHSIVRELIAHTARGSGHGANGLASLVESIDILVELGFFRIPIDEVYAPILQHALRAGNAAVAREVADKMPADAIEEAVVALANDRADAGRFDQAVNVLSVITIPSLTNLRTHMTTLHTLADHGVAGLSRHMTRDAILAHAVADSTLPPALLHRIGATLGFRAFEVTCMMARRAGMARAIDLCIDLIDTLPATHADEPDIRLVCETVLDVVAAFPLNGRAHALLQFALEQAPADLLPKVLGTWDLTNVPPPSPSPTRATSPSRASADHAKLRSPFHPHMFPAGAEPTYADVAAWFNTEEHVPADDDALDADALAAFRRATSVHAALAATPLVDPAAVSAAHQDVVVYAATKRMAVDAVRAAAPEIAPVAVLATPTPAAEEFAVLAAAVGDDLDPRLAAVADEMQALERQALDRALAEFPEVDIHAVLADNAYQHATIQRLLRVGGAGGSESVAAAIAIAEHAQVPPHRLVAAWIQSNAGFPGPGSLVVHQPAVWDKWIAETAKDADAVAQVLAVAKTVLQQESTSVQGTLAIHETAARLAPDLARQCRVRQALAEHLQRLKLRDWAARPIAAHLLAGDRAYFGALFHVSITSQSLFETVARDVLPKLASIAAIPALDAVPADATRLSGADLESVLTASWLQRRIAAELAAPAAPASPVKSPIVSPAQRARTSSTRSEDGGALGWLSSLASPIASMAHSVTHGGSAVAAPAAAAAAETELMKYLAAHIGKVQPADWSVLRSDLVALLRPKIAPAHRAAAAAVLDACPKSEPSLAPLVAGIRVIDACRAAGVRAPFLDNLFATTVPEAARQMLAQGVAISIVRDVAAQLGAALVGDTYASSAADIDSALRDLVASGASLTLAVAAVKTSPADARALLRHVLARMPETPALASAASQLAAILGSDVQCRIIAARASSLGAAAVLDMPDLDAVHIAWLQAQPPAHESRLRAVQAWAAHLGGATSPAMVRAWTREFQLAQTLPVEYLVEVRVQAPEFPVEIDQAILAALTSPVHALAFALTSAHVALVDHGKRQLPPAPPAGSGTATPQVWPAPLAPLVPVLTQRAVLADIAARFGLLNGGSMSRSTSSANEPLAEVAKPAVVVAEVRTDPLAAARRANVHPSLWAAVAVGRIAVPERPVAAPAPIVDDDDDDVLDPWGFGEPSTKKVATAPVAAAAASGPLRIGLTEAELAQFIAARYCD